MNDKIVIIYMPNGNEKIFTTNKHVNDSNYRLVDKIECEVTRVNIAWEEDGKIEGEAYVGMPYLLQMF